MIPVSTLAEGSVSKMLFPKSRFLVGAWLGLVILASPVLAIQSPLVRQQASQPPKQEIVLGALFSLTGNWDTLGKTSQAALGEAVKFINDKLATSSDRISVKYFVEDTKMDPDLALAALKRLEKKGARIILGPQSSAEILKIKPYADKHGLLLISQSSTAHSLALNKDNIFRFCPDDVLEGRAVAALMWQDGIKNFISVGRYDAGNSGLMISTNNALAALGGQLIGGVRYGPGWAKDFTAELKYLEAKVRQTKPADGHGLGIYAACFDEIITLFDQASVDHPLLATVPWYGSDGIAQSQALIKDKTAAQFAEKTGLPSPIFGLDENYRDKWLPLANKIKAKTGIDPDAFGLSVYDAAIVATLALLSVETDDIADLRQALSNEANSYVGITGPTILNEAGDRATGNFDFWAVRQGGWQKVAVYEAAADKITKLDNYSASNIENNRPADLLDQAHKNITTELMKLDAALAKAAFQLSQTGLSGGPARKILAQLCRDEPLACDVMTIDSQGKIIAAEPAKYRSIEGKNIADQDQFQRLIKTKKPVMSQVIKMAEGFSAFDLEQPIFSQKGEFIGAVSLLAKPDFWAAIVSPLIKGTSAEIWIMQKNGLLVYDTDEQQIDRNIFTDESYKSYPELLDLARQVAGQPEGAGNYAFLTKTQDQPVAKKLIWKTIGLHGTEFRLCLADKAE